MTRIWKDRFGNVVIVALKINLHGIVAVKKSIFLLRKFRNIYLVKNYTELVTLPGRMFSLKGRRPLRELKAMGKVKNRGRTVKVLRANELVKVLIEAVNLVGVDPNIVTGGIKC